MTTFITFYFWWVLVVAVIRCLTIGTANYPRTTKTSLGADVAAVLLNLPFLLWAAYLLWGAK